ncbi:MAG: extracellular solute-binding protein [Chloroflexi bacterium]|nr:extracellular solute-binding protein [Chloroflexota bacterium]
MHRFLAALTLTLLVGCTLVQQPAPQEATPQTTVAPQSEEQMTQQTPTPPSTEVDEAFIEENGEPGPLTLTVWIVRDLLPPAESGEDTALIEELAEFEASMPDVQVEVFIKRVDGAGGTLDYLRTAPDVAPTVLPDLVLLTREALVRASTEGLIVPLGEAAGPEIDAAFYDVAEDLVTVNGQIVGVPYVLSTQHSVYRTTVFTEEVPNSFEALLEERENPVVYTFPAGPVTGVSRPLLEQYLAAGGQLFNDEGGTVLTGEALEEVLTFYSEAREVEAIDPVVFQFATPAETWERYTTGQSALATVTSTTYLREREEVRSTGLTWTPTPDGTPAPLVEGLAWGLTTGSPDRQEAALMLLNFLLDPVNHGEFTQQIGWLPSQPAALSVWGDDDPYRDFGDLILNNASLLPDSADRQDVAAAIQEALEAVLLNGELPSQAAAQAAQRINGAE